MESTVIPSGMCPIASEIKDNSIHIASKGVKYLGINLIEEGKEMYNGKKHC
jgi:hypothetical protein